MTDQEAIAAAPSDTDKRTLADEFVGKITFQVYVETLHKAAYAKLPSLRNIREVEQRIIKELMDAGLLSNASIKLGFSTLTHPIVLTPAGAAALVEWSDFLRRESWWYKTGSALVRFLWVIVGAICATLPGLIR